MRKLITLLAALCLAAGAWAYDFKVDGIYYGIISSAEPYKVAVTYKQNNYTPTPEYTGIVTIPATVDYNGTTYAVTSIGFGAFRYCENLTSITIPNSVTSIGEGAFEFCSNLTSIAIPNSVTVIGNGTFAGCSSLTGVAISNLVTSIGNYAFYSCSSLTSITIPNSVTSIGSNAFYSCSSLTSITIPNSVTSIGQSAFGGCNGLTSITIPNSVKSIGRGAFSYCGALTNIFVEEGNTAYLSLGGVLFNKTQTELRQYPEKKQGTTYIIPNSVTSIGDFAFLGCSDLTSIIIPNSATSIGHDAFVGCSGLTSIIIPNSITSIGGSAFLSCSGLTSIIIPDLVTSIGDFAFSGCSGLTSITIGNSVTSIGQFAFMDCSGLTSATIGNSVTSIDYTAFIDCIGLTSIRVAAVTPPAFSGKWWFFAFSSVTLSTCVLEVPIGSKVNYQTADQWKDFLTINEVNFSSSVPERKADNVKIYAVNGELIIEGAENNARVELYDLSGILHYSGLLSGGKITLPAALPKGIYIVKAGGTVVKVLLYNP